MLRLFPIRRFFAAALFLAAAGVGAPGAICAQELPARIQDVQAHAEQDKVRIEIVLTSAVQPSLQTTVNPDRLVLDLPNTTAEVRQRHIAVNSLGIRAVRFGLNSATPPLTRVVIDLDAVHPYSLSADGKKIVLTITGTAQATAQATAQPSHRQKPASAASGPLGGMFHKKSELPTTQADRQASLPPPPAEHGPAWEPPTSSRSDSGSSAKSTATFGDAAVSAKHPKMGSLQTTTVYPTAESAPGQPPLAGAASATTAIVESAFVKSDGIHAVPSVASPIQVNATAAVAPAPPVAALASAEIALAARSRPYVRPPMPGMVSALAPPLPPPVRAAAPSPAPSPSAAVSATKTTTANSSIVGKILPQPPTPETTTTQPTITESTVPEKIVPSKADATVLLLAGKAPGAENALSPELAAAVEAGKMIEGTNPTTSFRVKHVAAGAAYLEGGRNSGLTEGMKLVIRDDSIKAMSDNPDASDPRVIAELEVVSVAETSAVTVIKSPKRPVKPGDLAYLSAEDEAALVTKRTLSSTRKYPMVMSFTEGDPLDEEVRVELPRPPQPSVNRTRLRLGLDYGGIRDHGASALTSTQVGFSARADITRIGGTFWNLNGFWRGRLTQNSAVGQPTLQDLLNRTYQMSLSYQNPQSKWVAGVGRLFLPWATSLDTLDGGYFGRRLSHGSTAGVFGGSTPDPTSWTYAPGRRVAGGFVNFEGGSYDAFHYFSTTGAAATTLNGQFDRPFVFFENSFSYKRLLSLYSAVQADNPPGTPAVAATPTTPAIPATAPPGAGLSRAFLTFRIQPNSRLSFDANYNYFRDVPAFDPSLISTGRLDKYLFQGISFGVRAEVIKNVTLYTTLGESARSSDKKKSLNQTYGAVWNQIFHTGIRSDVHYSKFDSSFGAGTYEAFSLSRSLMEGSRLEVQLGKQTFLSPIGGATNTKFINSTFDTNISQHYLLQGGITIDRGNIQNYDQWFFGLGYRFDNREKHQ